MIRRYLLLAAGLLTVTLGLSQNTHTLLWRISGKNSTRPSYLFGTMHVLCAQDAVLSDSMKAAIAGCDEIYFEINLSDMKGLMNSISYMQMKNNQRLSDLLKPDEYARVKDYFSKHTSMPFSMLERFKPMLVSGLIEEQGLDCETTDGMELMIMKEISRYTHKKTIHGLETAEFQAGVFDSIPYKKQAKELVSYIDSAEENNKEIRKLVEAYNKQDLDAIDEMSRKGDTGMEEYMDLLLYGRNRKWVKEMDTLLPKKSILIAVGAAHLPGINGVIDLLRKEGYTVEPVLSKLSG